MRIRPLALRLFFAATAASLFLNPSNAAPENPSALINELGAQVKLALADTTLSPIERQQHFRDLLDQDIDFPTIARFVLGRYWQGSSDSFRQEFTGVFEDYVIQSLSASFARYDGESIDITGTRVESERSTIVSSTITHPHSGSTELVEWRVQNTPAGYRIADVTISGVSMALAYREQFAAVIDRGGGQVAALIPALRQKLDDPVADSSAAASLPKEKTP
jgi:phospholipid transport system substrate-binding protein